MKKIPELAAILASAAFLALPLLAVAQTGIHPEAITPYSDKLISVINDLLVPALLAVAFIVFLYGVYKYFILGAADETSRTDGRQFVLWGVIGFAVILSVWGLVTVVINTFGLTTNNNPRPPTFEPSSGGGYSFPFSDSSRWNFLGN